MIHVHIVQLLVIVIVAAVCFYANMKLTPGGGGRPEAPSLLRNILSVLILAVAVLAILVSLGAIPSSLFTVST